MYPLDTAHSIAETQSGLIEAEVDQLSFVMFVGTAFSFTAFPVLARILTSSNLLGSPLGLQALSTAAIDDLLAWYYGYTLRYPLLPHFCPALLCSVFRPGIGPHSPSLCPSHAAVVWAQALSQWLLPSALSCFWFVSQPHTPIPHLHTLSLLLLLMCPAAHT